MSRRYNKSSSAGLGMVILIVVGGIGAFFAAVAQFLSDNKWIIVLAGIVTIAIMALIISKSILYKKLEKEVLGELGYSSWILSSYFDDNIIVKSRQTLDKYDHIKYLKENRNKIENIERVINEKSKITDRLNKFLSDNEYKNKIGYSKVVKKISSALLAARGYRVKIEYVSSAGNHLAKKEFIISESTIKRIKIDPSLIMGKGEYNKFVKLQEKEMLEEKQHALYERVNSIIDLANEKRDTLVIVNSKEQLDNLIAQLFDRTVNSIKKIKKNDSEEWEIIGDFISRIEKEVNLIISNNQMIFDYYESSDFQKIKDTCEALMSTQREFNDYINEKLDLITHLFGTRVVRNETVHEDEYNYIRMYKKTITPFTAEVSSNVFASAENNPLDYVVKYFYPNKTVYNDQIQKLQTLVEELETLKDAKQIIENYKLEYQQYIVDVPEFVMANDENGFYARLGFANIDESVLNVEYKFSYTSNGGFAQRSFTVPMTEDFIRELINILESKLTSSEFIKEQRTLMTKKLRDYIKNRDNNTCCKCGNSTYKEQNLLLEIDHIIPVSKGGRTEEDNLQTLCWKCNRAKGNKIMID